MATEDEISEVKQLIQAFYGFAGVPFDRGLAINERVAEVFGTMLGETRDCSKAIVWVPPPPGGRASIAWLARQFGRGVFNAYRAKLSVTCARAAIYTWNDELRMASLGITLKRLPAWS